MVSVFVSRVLCSPHVHRLQICPPQICDYMARLFRYCREVLRNVPRISYDVEVIWERHVHAKFRLPICLSVIIDDQL
jgi:hypothetical protein